jgi:hypothetical protein
MTWVFHVRLAIYYLISSPRLRCTQGYWIERVVVLEQSVREDKSRRTNIFTQSSLLTYEFYIYATLITAKRL